LRSEWLLIWLAFYRITRGRAVRISTILKRGGEGKMFKLSKEPPDGLLMSMAVRYDHGLGIPGYYDQFQFLNYGVTHEQRLKATLVTMRQLYDEVAGYGFFKYPEYKCKHNWCVTSPIDTIEVCSVCGERRACDPY
jgi:hypothetical protein